MANMQDKNTTQKVLFSKVREDEEGLDLEDIIQKYIIKSEELEKQESKVLKLVELVQSAVVSLQSWSRKLSSASSHTVRLNLKEIEEESRKIREETERIQKEVMQKTEENRKLQEEIDRRNSLGYKEEDKSETLSNEEEKSVRGTDRKKIEFGATGANNENNSDPMIQLFGNRSSKLGKMKGGPQKSSKLKKSEKVMFKREPNINKTLIETWKKIIKKI